MLNKYFLIKLIYDLCRNCFIMLKNIIFVALISVFLTACNSSPKTLPIYGKEAVKTETGFDTIVKPVPPFEFTDQKGDIVNNETFKDKIFIVDFFFTSCPSICPVMTKNMLKIHDHYLENDRIKYLSHSIDPKRDSVQRLDMYANKIDITTNKKWHFVTGDWEEIKKMAAVYMIAANIAKDAPGGYEHSGMFVLVDRKGQIRGFCNGTDEAAVSILMEDMDLLLDEK